MKKMVSLILALMLAAALTCAGADETGSFFARLEGIEWTFTSGAGGWSTDMRILPDGSFSGEYHDSEMGETGDGYPNGTYYGCSFTGKMSLVEQVDDYSWKIRVDELKPEEGREKETIEDGIRYVTSDIYGLSEGDEMLLYRPGTPVAGFTDDMKMWAHLFDLEETAYELETWFLSSEKNDSGFVGFAAEPLVGIANPWQDLTAEQLQSVSGLAFTLPEGAQDVAYRWLADEKLAEIQFTLDKDEFCFRAAPGAPDNGEIPDISGMYFSWENVEDVTVCGNKGTIGQAQTGSEDRVERCLWCDEAAGMIYSLSVCTTDLDGLNLTAVAEQICAPAAK